MTAFNFSQYKNIKIGETDIKKVKYGNSLLWPVPTTFMLYRNGVYYEVSGIQNNEYIVTAQYDANAPLVNITDMMFELGVPVQTKLIFEYAMCGFDGVLLNDERLSSRDNGTSNIHNQRTNDQITFRYMGGNSAGTSANSQTTNNTANVKKVLCNTQTENNYLVQFTIEPYTSPRYRKKIYLTDLSNDTQVALTSNTNYVYDLSETYQNQYMVGYTFKFGDINDVCKRSYGKKFWCNFYYLKIIDYDTSNLVGLYYFKNDNDTLKLYDYVSDSFMTSTSGNNASLTKLNKSIDIPGFTPNDYYYVDGTIEINGVYYEKLVNSLDSTKIKKGIITDQEQEQQEETIAQPTVSHDIDSDTFTFSCATPGATIYYTMGDVNPSDNPTVTVRQYTEPVEWIELEKITHGDTTICRVQACLNNQWSEALVFDIYDY